MSEAKNESVWEALDYEHDAIIEASAGTGKTYALEHIVQYLVEKKKVDVRNLLLVTFTEKAAGELKERIRKILVETKTDACSAAAKSLDEATICTIHSFCQELLREYPFESGMQMATEVVSSDRSLIEKAVQSIITSQGFKDKYGADFPNEMGKWDKSKDADDLSHKAIKQLQSVVSSGLQPEALRKKELEKIKLVLRSMPGNGKPGRYVLDNTDNGDNIASKCNSDRKSYFENLDEWLKIVSDDLADCGRRISAVCSIAGGKIDFVLKKWNGIRLPSGSKFNEQDGLAPFGRLHALCSALSKKFKGLDSVVTDFAYAEYFRLKARSRTITFDDMVLETSRMVKNAVEDAGNAAKQAFLKALRTRYRIALVDEFQDTDDKQWTIFSSLFSSRVNRIAGATPEQGCLIVVGDPKQAIYAFRGADIRTYLRAKDEIVSGGGQEFPLKEMYRSTKEMVDAFNAFFNCKDSSGNDGADSGGWFADMQEDGKPITYEDVEFPDSPPDSVKDFVYPEDETAVELLESVPPDEVKWNKKTCLPLFLENMTEEMKRLHGSEFWMNRPDIKDRMNWSSMCVLVRSHSDGDAAQKALRAKGIPCRRYKEAGLFASAESESILALFDYLSLPRKSGNLAALLLTPFFGVPLSEIEKRLEDGDKNFDVLCDRWRACIGKCEWVKFFDSAIDDTALGRPHVGDADFIRHRSGIRQIFDQLLERCGRARDLSVFSDTLRAWRRDDSDAGENGSVRNKESEDDAVQIMTMHAAKGLEFNAVFVASGFTGLGKISTEERQAQLMEMRRLFYVALTRAKYKLYLPWSKSFETKDPSTIGTFSGKGEQPLGAFLSHGIWKCCNGGQDAQRRVRGVNMLPTQNTALKIDGSVAQGANIVPDLPPRLGMKGWRFKWDSFSSLNHHGAKKVEEVEGAKPKEDEKQDAPDNQNEEQKLKSLVPKGALSGTVFHEVMETLCKNSKDKGEVDFEIGKENDFEQLVTETDDKKSPLLELVRRRLAANGVVNQVRKEDGETTASVIARMAWNALRTELDFGGDNKFRLCDDIPLKDRKAEVNFVLDESLLGDVRKEGAGALNGSIDLLVRRDDGYYIVDWKTNSLDNYKEETATAEMKEAGYDLQYKIYTLAAEKWLGEKTVKGIAYLFVRGGEVGDHPSGVFPHPMKEGEREAFVNNFRDKIESSDKDEADQEKEEL